MPEGERFRGTGAGAVSRILQDHRACDAGFDVSREEGPPGGRLRIRCKGCGEEMVYRASDAGSWGALQGLDADMPGEIGIDQRAGPVAAGSPWRALAIAAALILVAVLATVLLTRGEDDEESGAPPATAEQQAPAAGPEPVEERPSKKPRREPVVLDPRIIPTAQFSVGVAPGWDQGLEDGAVVFARNADAEVRVYYESGVDSYSTLLEGLEDLLRFNHPDARLSKPLPFEFGDVSGRRLKAVYPGGREIGVATTGSGYSYFVLFRVDGGAGGTVAREAKAIHASFRPL